jgi:spermidine/putrescine transport system permease protein
MASLTQTPAASQRSRRGRDRLRGGPSLLTLPAAAGLVIFFVAPLLTFVVYSFLTSGLFSVSGPLTLDAYKEALTTPLNGTLAINSLVSGALAASVSVAIALPIAYWLRYSAGRWQIPVLFLVTASMFASYLVRIYAWRTILGENGMLNTGLAQLGLIDQPIGFLLFSRFAVTVALVHIFLPYVVLVLFAAFRPLDARYLESAQDLGAGAIQRWRRVILPLIAAPAVTAFLFVFILSSADYVTPQFLGGRSGALLGVQISTNFKSMGDWPLGAALSMLMLAAFLLCYAIAMLGLRVARLDRIRWDT